MYKLYLISFLSFFYLNNSNGSKVDEYIMLGGSKSYDYKTRMFYNYKALKLLTDKNDSISREKIFTICWNYYYMNNFGELKKVSEIILKKSIQQKNIFHIAKAYRFYGIYYENVSINDSAFYYYAAAGKLFKKLNNIREICDNYRDKALIQYYTNDFLGSDLSLTRALEYAKMKPNIKIKEVGIYQSLGLNSFEMEDYNKALKYFNRAITVYYENKLYKENFSISYVLNNKAAIYYNLKLYNKALLILNKTLNDKLINSINYCSISDNIARIKIKKMDLKNAKKYLFQSSKIRDSLNINFQKNYNKLYLSEYYQAVKDTPKAQQYAHEAYNLSQSFRAPKDMLLCLKQLSKVDGKNALKYSKDYIRISDSMQILERQNRNKFAKIAYETEEITTEKDEAVQQKWIFLGVAVLIFVVGIMLFIIINQRIKQKELQFVQEQQKSDTEIYQLIQNQQHKIDEGREIEKKRIAQDLHDGIMNRLASTRLNLYMLNENSNKQTIQKCIPFIQGIQNIEKEIRNISHDLNKDQFSNTDSYLTILESLFAEQKIAFKAKTHFEIDKSINWEEIESIKKVHVYRILQEALNNIRKHAKATAIIASILNYENNLLIEIYDDGIGFSLNGKKKGIGLQNIYSRTKASDGTVEIKSHKDIGTTLILTIPKRKQTKNIQQNGDTDKYSYC